MLDRVPTKPNRYAVYDDAHNFLRYEYHERADEPTQVGDALNKANLLPDMVATALGLTGNPQVGDALTKLNTLVGNVTTLANTKAQIAIGSYVGTGSSQKVTLSFTPIKVECYYSYSAGNLLVATIYPNSSLTTLFYVVSNSSSGYTQAYTTTTNGFNTPINDSGATVYYIAYKD